LVLLLFLLIGITSKNLAIKNIKSIQYPLILFVLALAAAAISSSNKIISLKEFNNYITAILALLVAASLPWEDKYKVIRTIIFTGFVISIFAIYQYFFGFSHLSEYVAKNKITNQFVLDYIERKRIFYPFITPNTLAGYFILVMPLILIKTPLTLNPSPFAKASGDKLPIGERERVRGKLYYFKQWLILAMALFALILTKSIGALLSLFFGACLYIYLKKRLTRKKIAALGVLTAICILIFILRQTASEEHFLVSFSVGKRLDYWHQTLKIIKAHPFKGMGLGMFNLYSTRYAHNSYLQLWAEMGILGLISFLWLLFTVFKSILKKLGTVPNLTSQHSLSGTVPIFSNDCPYFLVISCVAFLSHNLVDFTFFLPEVSLIWWVILGLNVY
jgi:hypothetical protein